MMKRSRTPSPKQLLINIARAHHHQPIHFTGVSNIAATFDFRVSAGATPALTGEASRALMPIFGGSVAENPTISIVPIEGEEFTKRLLTPFQETKFMLLLRQRYDIDLLLRLMAQELRIKENGQEVAYRNTPADRMGYEMFRRVVTHLSAIQDQNQLYAEPLFYNRTWTIPASSVTAEGFQALEKEYLVTYNQKDNTYTLRKQITGQILITNYDPDTLSPDERARLIDETEEGQLQRCVLRHPAGARRRGIPPQGRFPTAKLQYHSQLSGPIAGRRPRIPRRQGSANPGGPGKSRLHHGTPAVGWRALGSRPVDSVPWKVLLRQHHRTPGTLEPRGFPIAVSLVPDDRQRGASRRSPQHHDCQVTGPQCTRFRYKEPRLSNI